MKRAFNSLGPITPEEKQKLLNNLIEEAGRMFLTYFDHLELEESICGTIYDPTTARTFKITFTYEKQTKENTEAQ